MRIKRKIKTEQQKEKSRVEKEKMWNMFIEIWDSLLEKKCWQCGAWLGREPKSYMFDHAIDKSIRPELKYTIENIFICCLDCHDLKSRGFPGDKHKKFIEAVKNKFNIGNG